MYQRNEHESLLSAIMAKAAEDADFRRRLLTDPRNAIYDHFGVRVPDSYSVKFVEREPGVDALVVLPDPRGQGDAESDELSESDLEAITGGVLNNYSWTLDYSPGGSDGQSGAKENRRDRRSRE